MQTVRLILLLTLTSSLFAGWLDWLYDANEPKATQFHCPHHCGEWGSESIKKVEWLAVLALYEIDKMSCACKNVPFPYHLPPNDEEDLWYKNAYPRWVQVEMPMNSQPLPGCERAFPAKHRYDRDRLSCSYCQASDESPAYSWCFSHTTRGDNAFSCVSMPGNPKSPNPAQRKPYVVQRKGADAVSKSGKLINRNLEEAHIPLGEFEFKGW